MKLNFKRLEFSVKWTFLTAACHHCRKPWIYCILYISYHICIYQVNTLQGRLLQHKTIPVHSPAPPFQSAAVPSAPTPFPFSSSPQHELSAVSAGMPAPAAASPGCAASPVQSVSWALRTAAIKTCRRRSARSGPAADPLWNCPAEPPPPGIEQSETQGRLIRSNTSLLVFS